MLALSASPHRGDRGGRTVRRADGAVIGSTAIGLIGQFKVDYAIIGASAIDEEGALLDFDYREVQAAQAIIANARSVVLVATRPNLRRTGAGCASPYQPIQTFVTDVPCRPGSPTSARPADQVIEAIRNRPPIWTSQPVDAPSTVTRLR